MSSNPGGSGVVEHLKKMLGEPLFCWGLGLGLVMPLGQFPPNVAVGLLASIRVLYARNLCSTGVHKSLSSSGVVDRNCVCDALHPTE